MQTHTGELRRCYARLAEAVAPSAPIAAQLVELGVPPQRVTRSGTVSRCPWRRPDYPAGRRW
jgi:hypothetical protein